MMLGIIGEIALDTVKLGSLGLDYTYWQARASGFSERDFHVGFVLSTFVGFGFLLMAAYPETRHPVLASMVLTLPPGQYDWRRILKYSFWVVLGLCFLALLLTAPTVLSLPQTDGGMTIKEMVGDHEARLRVLEKGMEHMIYRMDTREKIDAEMFSWLKYALTLISGAILTYVVNEIIKTYSSGRKARAKED